MLYDLIIVGAGPAGLTASIYASRYQLKNLVIGKILGGTMTYAHKVENYPGVPNVSGTELGQKMGQQVKKLGAEIISETVTRIEKNEFFEIFTDGGKEYQSKALIIATGTERRKLDIPGEKEYLGRGVSYCTNCDAPFFKDKVVVVVGGADSACSGATHLTSFARQVYLIYRKDALRAEPVWLSQISQNPKIKVIYNTNLTEIIGDQQKVIKVKLDLTYQGKNELVVDGIFVEIGGIPMTALLKNIGVILDEEGYVKVTPEMKTNIDGLFAAGDLANVFGEFHQITSAVAEGSLAAFSAFKYLKQ